MQKTSAIAEVFASVVGKNYFFFAAFLAAFFGAAFFAAAFFGAAFLAAFFGAAFLAPAFLAAATRDLRFAGRLLPVLPMVRFPFLVFLSPFPIVWSVSVWSKVFRHSYA